MASTPSMAAPTAGLFSLLRHASFSAAPPKRPAPPEPASAPRAKRAVSLDSPPAILPPGAPSASASSITPPPGLQSLAEGESAQSSGSALTASALELEEGLDEAVELLTEAELAAVLEGEEVISEMQDIIDTAHEVIEVSEDRPSRKRTRALESTNLKQKFVELVMCDFTPRNPRELPITARWVSFDRLYQLFQPHASVCQRGPGNLRQRIIEWYKDPLPAFIGLAPREWCKRVTSNGRHKMAAAIHTCTSFASSTLRGTCLASEFRCVLACSRSSFWNVGRSRFSSFILRK